MRWQGEELQRVRSESELRPGMTVVLGTCRLCDRRHAAILVARFPGDGHQHLDLIHGVAAGDPCNHSQWTGVGFCCDPRANGRSCLSRIIAEGRLYRLRDEEPSQEQSTERRRPLEIAR
jgi:hypothetical protein